MECGLEIQIETRHAGKKSSTRCSLYRFICGERWPTVQNTNVCIAVGPSGRPCVGKKVLGELRFSR